MSSIKGQFEALNDDISRLIESVETDTDVGRQIRDSLQSLGDNVTKTLHGIDYLLEQQTTELLSIFSQTRDAIVQQIEMFGDVVKHEIREHQRQLSSKLEDLSSEQIGAMFASAAMVRNAIQEGQRANDPLFQAAQRWATLIKWVITIHNRGDTITLSSLLDDLIIINGFGRDQAEAMIRRLIDFRILLREGDTENPRLRLDPESSKLKWAIGVINSGNLPLLQ